MFGTCNRWGPTASRRHTSPLLLTALPKSFLACEQIFCVIISSELFISTALHFIYTSMDCYEKRLISLMGNIVILFYLVLAPCWEIILLWKPEIEMRLLWDVAAKCDRGIDLLYPTQSQIFKILNELHKMVTLNKRKENIQSQHIKGTGLVTWLRGRHYHSSLPPAIIYFSGPSTIISVSSDDDDDDDDQKEPGDHLQLSLAAPPFFLTPFVSPGVGRWRWRW